MWFCVILRGGARYIRARVRQERDALSSGDAEGVEALRADAPRALHHGAVDDLLTRVTLDPQALGDVDAARLTLGSVGFASKPRHIPRRGAAPPFRTSPLRWRRQSRRSNR